MRLLLIRHALCAPVGHALSGRRAGVSLDARGRAQLTPLTARVARRLGTARLDAVYASPMARALETAAAVAAPARLDVTIEPALVEFDFGEWTGQTIAALDAARSDAWTHFNACRSASGAPGGEGALAMQARAVGAVRRMAERHADGVVAAVSHSDVCRAIVGHCLGVSLDVQHRIEIAPASVTELELRPWGARLLALNDEA